MVTFSAEQVKEISGQLDIGFRAFYHIQSGELIFVPNTDNFFDIDRGAWKKELAKLKKNGKAYQEIYAMEPSDSFKVMAEFAEQLTDKKLQEELLDVLDQKKPFSNYKYVIDNSAERGNWFDFKNKRSIKWTADQLKPRKQLSDFENDSE